MRLRIWREEKLSKAQTSAVSLWCTCNETTQFNHPEFIKKTRKSLTLLNAQSRYSEAYSGKEAFGIDHALCFDIQL